MAGSSPAMTIGCAMSSFEWRHDIQARPTALQNAKHVPGGMMIQKIALEEHFLSPEYVEPWLPTVAEMPAAKREFLLGALTDFGERRLASMDKAGIKRAVLAIAGPGAQAERDAGKAQRNAKASNDFLAKEIQKRPDRYSGFAHLAMQDAKAAADELERCVKQLKFCGAMINGHTNGQYLDHPSLAPFWERAE